RAHPELRGDLLRPQETRTGLSLLEHRWSPPASAGALRGSSVILRVWLDWLVLAASPTRPRRSGPIRTFLVQGRSIGRRRVARRGPSGTGRAVGRWQAVVTAGTLLLGGLAGLLARVGHLADGRGDLALHLGRVPPEAPGRRGGEPLGEPLVGGGRRVEGDREGREPLAPD